MQDIGAAEPFLGSVAVAERAMTEKQLRSPYYVRIFQNVYVETGTPITHRLLCQGVSLIAPTRAVITGASAATLRGLELAGSTDPVEVVLPPGVFFRAQRGIHIRKTKRGRIDAEPWRDIRVAVPLRAALDLARNTRLHGPLPATVGKLDAMLHAGLIDAEGLAALLEQRHDHGVVHARKALQLCDGRSESIRESIARVRLAREGIILTPQVEVYGPDGRFIGRVDLAIEEFKLAIEYDGEYHQDPEQQRRDAVRLARLRAAGWTVLVITKHTAWDGPDGLIETVREAVRQGERSASRPA